MLDLGLNLDQGVEVELGVALGVVGLEVGAEALEVGEEEEEGGQE